MVEVNKLATLFIPYLHPSFGEAFVDSGSTVTNNLRFAGQYYDSETGLHYNYHRYYDPSTGRYLTPDPIGIEGGINLYAYTSNNPINEIDPLGLWGAKIAFYWGYGGSVTFGKDNGKIFIRTAGGVGVGGGFSYNPEGGIPRSSKDSPCEGAEGFIGPSAWVGASLGPLSTGWAGHAGIAISEGQNGRPNIDYVEDSGFYGSASPKNGWGLKLGGGLNLIDVGVAW